MNRNAFGLGLVVVAAFGSSVWAQATPAAAPAAVPAEAPAAVVRGLTDAMLSVLKDSDKLGFQGRYDRLAPAVEAAFDIEFMSEKSLGSSFAKLNAEQRQQWRTLFHQYMVTNYAARLNKFNGQLFEQVGEEEAPSNTKLVRVQVVDPGKEKVDLNYRLRLAGERWRIVDIYLKGTVSELALRRSDFATVMRNQGYDALVTHLKAKLAEMAAGKAD